MLRYVDDTYYTNCIPITESRHNSRSIVPLVCSCNYSVIQLHSVLRLFTLVLLICIQMNICFQPYAEFTLYIYENNYDQSHLYLNLFKYIKYFRFCLSLFVIVNIFLNISKINQKYMKMSHEVSCIKLSFLLY